MKLQNAHPLKSFIVQFHSVKFVKIHDEGIVYRFRLYIYIYIHSSLVATYFVLKRSWRKLDRKKAWKDQIEGRKKEKRFHRGGKSLLYLYRY